MSDRNFRAIVYKLVGERVQNYKKDVLVKEANLIYNSLCKQNNIAWDNNRANAFQHAYISAKYAYEFGEDKALLIGNLVEISTWDDLYIDDINKDLYNNRTGTHYATMGINNGLSLDDVAILLFNDIQAGTQDFIIDASANNDKFYIQDLSYSNLIFDTLQLGIKIGVEPDNMLKAIVFSSCKSFAFGIQSGFTTAEEARVVQYQDPLLIDLDGDGIETTTIDNGVYFDHGNDGFEELSAWVGVDDGILVYDKNNNGVIDNGNELFSDNYTKLDGTQAVSGFDALGDFDSNSDGVINSSDTNFDTIKVLKGDGTMMSLSDAGVSSITLLHTNKNVEDANGNVQKTEGTYTRTDGSTSKLGDYLFANDSITTIAKDWLEVPETITELPDIAGMGNVYSLHQAMVRDEELKTLVEGFATTSTPRARQLLVEQIIYKWSGVEAVSTDSRGSSVDGRKLEALEEFVGREFVGMSSSGTQTATNPGVNAGKILTNTFTKLVDYVYAELEAQTVLKPVFEQLEFSYDETLDKYVYDLSTVKSTIDETILTNAVTGKELLLDFAKVFVNLGLEDVSNYADFKSYFVAKGEEYELLFKTIDSINLYGTGDGEDIDGSPESETIFGYEGNDNILARQGDDLVYGGSGDDVIDTCYGNDVIFGEEGNDTIKSGNDDDVIYGGSGDDVIWSGSGNDTVYGGAGNDSLTNQGGNDYVDLGAGDDSYTSNTVTCSNDTIICGAGNDTYYDSDAGNDTYIFNLGDGNDFISNNNGNDIVRFGAGISLANTIFGCDDSNNLVIRFKNPDDTLKISGCLGSQTLVVEQFEFVDGTVLSFEEVLGRLSAEGTEGDDVLSCGNGSETIYGYGGNDTITARNGDDIIYGGVGNDVINTGKGNDIVYGGEGNDRITNIGGDDYIDGGAGDDSYTSNTVTRSNDTIICGAGNDTYYDSDAGNDTYIFNLGDGNDIISDNNGNDEIVFGEGISLANTKFYGVGVDLMVLFQNGSDTIKVNNFLNNGTGVVEGFEFSDGSVLSTDDIFSRLVLEGTEGNDRLTGTKVSETIYGYGGDDVINSGKGDDKVYAGAGNDTLSNLGGNDYIDMGAGNDSYVSNTITRANDTVIGGEGNDSIRDSDAGNDTYIFNLGDGEDVLYDNNGEDVIRFGSSVDIFNVGLYKDNLGDIYIDYGTTSGSDVLQVRSQNSGTSVVERYEFEQSEGEVVELTNAEINVILQDMNAYAQEQEILISSVTDVKNNPDLMNIIATGIAA